MLKHLVLATLLLILSGCKLYVISLEGGEVQSVASGTCLPLTNCVHQVVDTNYTESFTAVPVGNRQFVKWRSGPNYLCGNSTDPTCVVTTTTLAGVDGIDGIIATAGDFFISPIFGPSPITDTVVFKNKEWAQVPLFANTSFADIDAACPAETGICHAAGELNGYSMAGWTWASVDDLNELFNTIIGSTVLGPGPDDYREAGSTWAPDFFLKGFAPGPGTANVVNGRIRLSSEKTLGTELASLADLPGEFGLDAARTNGIASSTGPSSIIGAWFYRPK